MIVYTRNPLIFVYKKCTAVIIKAFLHSSHGSVRFVNNDVVGGPLSNDHIDIVVIPTDDTFPKTW